MYEFLDRLVNIAIPRIRDFRGVSNRAFDGRGSYSLGVKEQIIFPEIEYDKIDALRGMDIAINTSAKNRRRGARAAHRVPLPVPPGTAGQAARTAEGLTNMARLSVKLREKKRRNTVAKFKAKRAALLEVIHDQKASDEDRDAARAKLQKLPRDASPVAPAQPLRADRAPARRLPQVRPRAQQAARTGDARRSAGRDQGELVRSAR